MISRAFRDIWSLVRFFKFSNCTRPKLVQKHHSCPYIMKCTRIHTISYANCSSSICNACACAWQEHDCFSTMKRPYALGGYNLKQYGAMYTELTLFTFWTPKESQSLFIYFGVHTSPFSLWGDSHTNWSPRMHFSHPHRPSRLPLVDEDIETRLASY